MIAVIYIHTILAFKSKLLHCNWEFHIYLYDNDIGTAQLVTGWNVGVRVPLGTRIFSTSSTLDIAALSPEVKQQGCKLDRTSLDISEIKKM
jgi:hypothetical protein